MNSDNGVKDIPKAKAEKYIEQYTVGGICWGNLNIDGKNRLFDFYKSKVTNPTHH